MEYKVKSTTDIKKLSSAIVQFDNIILKCIGAGSVNQAVKALCIVESMTGNQYKIIPKFEDVNNNGDMITGISIMVNKE